MPDSQKVDIRQVEAGFEFPPATFRLDAATVADYLAAVEEDSPLYRDSGLVPPMAVAALALASLSGSMDMPPGTIHVSQEVEFREAVSVSDTLTSRAAVARSQRRSNMHMVTVDIRVADRHQREVMTARTSFILPEESTANATE